MCHLYPYNNVKLPWKFFYINEQNRHVSTAVVVGNQTIAEQHKHSRH